MSVTSLPGPTPDGPPRRRLVHGSREPLHSVDWDVGGRRRPRRWGQLGTYFTRVPAPVTGFGT